MTAPAIDADLEALYATGDDKLIHWACLLCNVPWRGTPVLLCGKVSHWEFYDPGATGQECAPCREATVCPKCGAA